MISDILLHWSSQRTFKLHSVNIHSGYEFSFLLCIIIRRMTRRVKKSSAAKIIPLVSSGRLALSNSENTSTSSHGINNPITQAHCCFSVHWFAPSRRYHRIPIQGNPHKKTKVIIHGIDNDGSIHIPAIRPTINSEPTKTIFPWGATLTNLFPSVLTGHL